MGTEVARKTRPDGSFYSSDPKERAMQLKEDGKIGGQFGKLGGRPRKPRASEIIADEARKDAELMIQVLRDGLQSESEKTKLATLQTYIAIEQDEAKLRLQEERQEFDIGQASREELLNYMKEALTAGSPLANQLGVITLDESDVTELGESGHGYSEEISSSD